jgi:hypothetical protein
MFFRCHLILQQLLTNEEKCDNTVIGNIDAILEMDQICSALFSVLSKAHLLCRK